MIQNTLPSHRAFVVPHHSSKTTVLASALLVAQAHGRLPVSGENLYAGLVLGAIFLRLLTTYVNKVKLNRSSKKTILIQDWDPYQGMENNICGLLYGQPKEEEGKKDK